MKKLFIYVCATEDYLYATEAQARCVRRALGLVRGRVKQVKFVLVGPKDANVAKEKIAGLSSDACEIQVVSWNSKKGEKAYDNQSQLLIAQMRQFALDEAVKWEADLVWGLDADVLPKPNSLRCMMDTLEYDGGELYQVAFCPYPSQGGGPFMGGRGTVRSQICPDFYEDECEVVEEYIEKRKDLEKKLASNDLAPLDRAKIRTELKDINKKIRGAKPKGNVFEMNGEKWRKRGWCDSAYPALGRGAMVPFDWCGSGCTLMSQRAYLLCDWTGYEGEGTEDLYVIWRRWYPAGIRIGGVLHCPADHVIRSRNPKEEGKFIHIVTGHETEGDMEGHLRQIHRPFYQQIEGEVYDVENDGQVGSS